MCGEPVGTTAADVVAPGVAPAAVPPLPVNPDAAAGATVVAVTPAAPGAAVVAVVAGAVVGVVANTVAGAQVVGTVMVLASRVTAALRARMRPWTVAPVSSVAEVRAISVPTNVLDDARVAELPTTQKTLHAWAPFSSSTDEPEAVTRSEEAWKMNTPLPLSTSGLAAVRLAVVAWPKA